MQAGHGSRAEKHIVLIFPFSAAYRTSQDQPDVAEGTLQFDMKAKERPRDDQLTKIAGELDTQSRACPDPEEDDLLALMDKAF